MRAAIAFAAIVAINVLLNPGLVRGADGHRQQILDWLARITPLWPAFAIAVVATLLVLPWACFRYAQWRYKGLEATALLPVQRRELSLPIGRDDAFALAKRAMQDDLALYAVRADAEHGYILAGRATPLRGRSIRFVNHRGGAAAAGIPGGEGVAASLRRPLARMGVARPSTGLRLGPPARRSASPSRDRETHARSHRRADEHGAAFGRRAGCNRRHVESIARAITALAQPLIAQRREAQDMRNCSAG